MFSNKKDKKPNAAQDFLPEQNETKPAEPGPEEVAPEASVEPTPVEPELPPTATQAPVTPKKKPTGRGRWVLRWFLSLLIAFGLGLVAAIFLLYLPTREQQSRAQVDLEQAQGRISELESRVTSLQGLETTNQEVKSQAEQASVHVALLKAEVDAYKAQVALAKQDTAGAQLALSKTPQTLNSLKTLLPAEQQNVVNSLQQRLDLAVQEIKAVKNPAKDSFAAQSDLEVLAASLAQLEATLFAR